MIIITIKTFFLYSLHAAPKLWSNAEYTRCVQSTGWRRKIFCAAKSLKKCFWLNLFSVYRKWEISVPRSFHTCLHKWHWRYHVWTEYYNAIIFSNLITVSWFIRESNNTVKLTSVWNRFVSTEQHFFELLTFKSKVSIRRFDWIRELFTSSNIHV